MSKYDKHNNLVIIIANIGSSREVLGGGDIRLLGLMHALSRLKTWNLILLNDKYYAESLVKWAHSNGLEILANFNYALSFPRYLPPYKKLCLVLKYIVITLSSFLYILKKKIIRPLVIIWSNQVYQYVIWGIEPIIRGLIVYVQAPLLRRSVFKSLFYVSLIGLLKALSYVKRIIIFVFNPIDYVLMKYWFKDYHNVKVMLTRNGVFLRIAKKVLREAHTIKYDIIYVGRLDQSKRAFQNFITLLRKLAKLRIKVRTAIVTSCLREELRQIVARALKSVENHEIDIFVNVPTKGVYEIYSKSKVLVMLSELDVFNNAILEAVSMGCDAVVLENPRIKLAYKLLMKFLPESMNKRIHFVKDIDEAVNVVIDLIKRDKDEYDVVNIELPYFIDWRYIILRELLTVVRWLR